jgi:hypothetical protein
MMMINLMTKNDDEIDYDDSDDIEMMMTQTMTQTMMTDSDDDSDDKNSENKSDDVENIILSKHKVEGNTL